MLGNKAVQISTCIRTGCWLSLTMVIVLGVVPSPAAAPEMTANKFPKLQATEPVSQPVVVAGTGAFAEGGTTAPIGSYIVPAGRVLILDGATADLQAATTIEELALTVEISISIPGQDTTGIGTDPKVITFPIDGGSGFISVPASSALPPMHLPPGTEISVNAIRNNTLFAHDVRVIVSGHLVPAVAEP